MGIKFYAYIQNDSINGGGRCKLLTEGIYNVEITEDVYNNLDHYMAIKHEDEGEVTYEVILNPNYDKEQAAMREEIFKEDFFYVPTFGWYRKKPKGYSSAIESINTAQIAVSYLKKLPAGTLIFYQTPDFTNPEECTEAWLIQHQIPNSEMSVEEFGQFIIAFITAWNKQEHESLLKASNDY